MAVLVTFCIALSASFAALFNESPTSWAVLPIESRIPFRSILMSRLCTCPDWTSSDVGVK
jgi:hypothetical protein